PDIVHMGLTTWSGNPAMMRVAEKSGMTKEGTIRQVRYWQGRYYDSVKYGVLHHELQSHL
ncbi:MAG: GNAT family N-acetyltransferase, partial [Lactococcus sp.]|nr:GNAT family N-acetyltransferase [Lactococcus sp.]